MNVYDPFCRGAKVKRIYFYTVDPDHTLTEYCKQSTNDIPWSDMPRVIDEIVAGIADGSIRPTKSQQHHRVWKTRSYFVYYDKKGQLEPNNAVTFRGDDSCFLDGADVPGALGIHAFYCINHMRKGGQDQGPRDRQHFEIDVNHMHHARAEEQSEKSRGAAQGGASNRPLFTHNDSGTNTGPPGG
jgi:hypothetical protein